MVILEACPEEKLVPVFVEASSRNAHWTAECPTRVVVRVCGLLGVSIIEKPIVCVESVVTGRKESAPVVVSAAGLGYRGDDNRPFLFFRAKVRRQNLEFLNEIRIRIHWCIAVAARIGDVSPIRRYVERISG